MRRELLGDRAHWCKEDLRDLSQPICCECAELEFELTDPTRFPIDQFQLRLHSIERPDVLRDTVARLAQLSSDGAIPQGEVVGQMREVIESAVPRGATHCSRCAG